MGVKFRNIKTGKVYATWDATFCKGVACSDCPLGEYNRAEGDDCWTYLCENPEESEKVGYEPIYDEAPERIPMGDTGFVRDAKAGKGRMDLLPWRAIIELSRHCEVGAINYGERNIDKGAPLHSLLDSGARHLAKYMSGEQDEDHLRAACWNLMWALNQRYTHPELNDTPWPDYKEGKHDKGNEAESH